MKRKGLALLLTFCMLAAGAAGCGQTAADSSGAASNAPEQAQEESKQGGGEVEHARADIDAGRARGGGYGSHGRIHLLVGVYRRFCHMGSKQGGFV